MVHEGDGLRELTKRVNSVFDQAERWRAERIAATEASRAVHAAQWQSEVESGVVAGHEWLASGDACPICQVIAQKAKRVQLGQRFAVVGDHPTYQDIRHPPAHPGCQCAMVAILTPEFGGPAQVDWKAPLIQPKPGDWDGKPVAPEPQKYQEPPKPTAKPKAPPKPKPIPAPAPPPPPKPAPVVVLPPKPKPKPAPVPPPAPSPAVATVTAPPAGWPDAADLVVVKQLGGSTGAELVEDKKTGKRYVRKRGKSQEHIRAEYAADLLYEGMGARVPKARLYETASGPFKLAEYLEGDTLGSIRYTDKARYDAAIKQLQENFAIDALLGNWDVIGMSADNVLVTKDGKAYRIDNGGSLKYRAQGGIKPAKAWGSEPDLGELTSMRTSINPMAAGVFGSMSDDDVAAQVSRLGKTAVATVVNLRAAGKLDPETAKVLLARVKLAEAWAQSVRARPTAASLVGIKTLSAAECEEWTDAEGRKRYDAWARALPAAERSGTATYTGQAYKLINKAYREGTQKKLSPAHTTAARNCQKALDRGQLDTNLRVWRGIHLSGVGNGLKESDLQVGRIIRDPAFKSCSVNINTAFSGTKVEVRLPKGMTGAGYVNAGSISVNPHEQEFLVGLDWDEMVVVETHPKIVVQFQKSTDPGRYIGQVLNP